MTLSEILRRLMEESNTTAAACAAEIGLSPQNFGQRLKRGTLTAEQIAEAATVCGYEITVCARLFGDSGSPAIYFYI